MSFLDWLLVAAVFVIIGFICGALVTLWWVGREKAPAQERPQKAPATVPIPTQPAHAEAAVEEPPAAPAPAPQQAPKPAPRVPAAPPDVLPPQPSANVVPQRAPAQGQKPTPPPPAPTAARPEPAPAQSQEPVPPPPTTVRPESAPAQSQKPTPPPPTSARPERAPAEGQKPAPPPPKSLPLLSIVEQIDLVFQELLAASELAGQPIRLMEDPVQGVVVRIGSEQYSGIDAVPDPKVSALIRKAVVEWEKQTGDNRS